MPPAAALLNLLQLVSPALPVGAYSYSEGIETLVQTDRVRDLDSLQEWLSHELQAGSIRLEAAIVTRLHQSAIADDRAGLQQWNHWLSAFRETTELREQSWQMGRSLARLLIHLQPTTQNHLTACGEPCNFATAFAIGAAHWQIPVDLTVLGYLQSWSSNLISAGVRLIPLGQTQGQQILLNLQSQLEQTAIAAVHLPDTELWNCSWGLSIASMNHETLYSRLFRS